MAEDITYALVWDQIGEHTYETGVDHGVLYQLDNSNHYVDGVAWNGLTNVTETPSGAEGSKMYADNIPYLTIYSAEEFSASIEAYTYPDEFEQNDGTATLVAGVTIGQQTRKTFGLSYRTKLGNDVQGEEYGYKLHLMYGCRAAPSERGYETINDSPEAITFSWEITTTPVAVTGAKPTALVVIDSTKVDETKLKRLEAILYGTPAVAASGGNAGTEAVAPRLPLPDEVKTLLQ